jgi:hypothetical protein
MPARTCGRRNISLRCQLLIDSLAPGKSRTGNHQLPPEIHLREQKKMLYMAVLRQSAGKSEACRYRWGRRRHASDFNPGFVTFVGKRDTGVWWIEHFRCNNAVEKMFLTNRNIILNWASINILFVLEG